MASSLVVRISVWSIPWIALALVATAFILTFYYRDHSQSYYDVHIRSHIDELVDYTVVAPDGALSLSSLPSDPNFQRAWSGWYWEVRQADQTIARSASLGNERLSPGEVSAGDELVSFEAPGPNSQPLRMHMLQLELPGVSVPVTYLASAPAVHVSEDVRNYAGHILYSFAVLGLGLIVAVVVQIRQSLRPLKAVGVAIREVREGKRQRFPDDFPSEIQPLVDELNNLLQHNMLVLNRARDQVGDLAHALKNPLAIIKNESRHLPDAQRDLIIRQVESMSGDVENYLVRARSSGQVNLLGARTPIHPVLEDLIFALQHIHGDQALQWEKVGTEHAVFFGETEDLEEMLGNLLDNAAKWATSRVQLSCRPVDGRIMITVEDDGPGIPDELRNQAMQRGIQLDESKPGHGLGLSIAKELADLYRGSLGLEPSELGGLKATLMLPGSS